MVSPERLHWFLGIWHVSEIGPKYMTTDCRVHGPNIEIKQVRETDLTGLVVRSFIFHVISYRKQRKNKIITNY